MLKVEQMRKELIAAGVDEDVVNSTKGKNALKKLYEENIANIDEVEATINVIEKEVEKKNEAKDEEGNDSNNIMDLFKPSELQDGAPKVNGLRRVATEVIGPIVDEKLSISQIDCTFGNSFKGTGISVVFSITFRCTNEDFGYIDEKITFTDAADCIPNFNCNDLNYSKHMTALATTRAEARVLRKALRLNVVAAEEIDDGEPIVISSNPNSITAPQIKALDVACKNKGINLEDILKEGGIANKMDELTQADFFTCQEIISKKKINKEKSNE